MVLCWFSLDKMHKDLGDQERHLQVPGVGIEYNDNQKKAVKKALTSSFSLIQGPPGNIQYESNMCQRLIITAYGLSDVTSCK
jgi:hypothetical protein